MGNLIELIFGIDTESGFYIYDYKTIFYACINCFDVFYLFKSILNGAEEALEHVMNTRKAESNQESMIGRQGRARADLFQHEHVLGLLGIAAAALLGCILYGCEEPLELALNVL